MKPTRSSLCRFFLFSFLLVLNGGLAAQSQAIDLKLDSIERQLYGIPDYDKLQEQLREVKLAYDQSFTQEQAARWYFVNAEAGYFNGDLAGPIRDYQRADSVLTEIGDSSLHRWVRVKDRLAGRVSQTANFTEATEHFLGGIALATFQEDSLELLELRTELISHYSRNWFYDLARQQSEKAEKLAIRLKSSSQLVEINIARVLNALRQEDVSEALRTTGQLDSLFRIAPRLDVRYHMYYHSFALETHALNGDKKLTDHHRRLTDSLRLGPLANSPKFLIHARYGDACWHSLHGRHDRAVEMATELVEDSEQENNPNFQEVTYRLRYRVEKAAGNLETAFVYLKKLHQLERDQLNANRTAQIGHFRQLFEREQSSKEKIRRQQELDEVARRFARRMWFLGGLCAVVLLGWIIFYLVRKRKDALREIHLQSQHAREIISKTSQLRRRIAMNLHDSVGQNLVLLRQQLRGDVNLSPATEKLVDEAIEEVRSISKEAHNTVLDQLGLSIAIKQLLEKLDENTTLFINAEIEQGEDKVPPEVAQHLYAIVQEALQNVIKHAQATAVRVSCQLRGGAIYLAVEDNGVGIKRREGRLSEGLGMYSMRERAAIIGAVLTVRKSDNGGTLVSVEKRLIQ